MPAFIDTNYRLERANRLLHCSAILLRIAAFWAMHSSKPLKFKLNDLGIRVAL